ncbi:hypothetical protein APTSU1_001619700 [Apodemus speciosus]|uniref:Uncharacterized protein n=1 Tax=Apodemus speciosus TaxID=105296 RepID=A0ABQ0FNY7_APOSI
MFWPSPAGPGSTMGFEDTRWLPTLEERSILLTSWVAFLLQFPAIRTRGCKLWVLTGPHQPQLDMVAT